MAERIRAIGVKPELEVSISVTCALPCSCIGENLIDDPPFFQFALGTAWGAPSDAQTILMMPRHAAAAGKVGGIGIGPGSRCGPPRNPSCWEARPVGLEDNLYLSRGKLANPTATSSSGRYVSSKRLANGPPRRTRREKSWVCVRPALSAEQRITR